MEIGAANQGGGKKNGGVHNVNAGNQGRPPGNQGGPQRSDRNRVEKNQCLRCKGFGHWKNECPNGKGSGGRGAGSVNNVDPGGEPDSENDEDDSTDWVGCAELGSGNSKGQA